MKNFIFLLSFLMTSYSFSQESSHIIDIKNKDCIENAVPTTIGSIKCEQAALALWKTEMNRILKKLKTNPRLLNVTLLNDTQAKWLAFHESNVKFYYSYYRIQYQGGTMARVAAVSYEKRHLRERVLYLLALHEELHE